MGTRYPPDYYDEDEFAYDSYDDQTEDDLWDEDEEALDEEEELPDQPTTGEHDVEISMEIDERGNEVWYATDPRMGGKSSMGHSLEEAMEGVEDRRKAFRDMLKRSREDRSDDLDD